MHHATRSPVTRHFTARAQHRGLRGDVLDFVLGYGVEVEAADAHSYTVVEKLLPADLIGAPIVRRAREWVVVTSRDGVLITCYRRKAAARFLKVKSERRYGLARRASRSSATPLDDGAVHAPPWAH